MVVCLSNDRLFFFLVQIIGGLLVIVCAALVFCLFVDHLCFSYSVISVWFLCGFYALGVHVDVLLSARLDLLFGWELDWLRFISLIRLNVLAFVWG